MTVYDRVGGVKYINLKEAKAGDLLVEGRYVESKPSNRYPTSTNHVFQPDEGPRHVVSGGHLGWLLEEYVKPGDRVQVYYKGKEKLDKGKFAGSESHQFELGVVSNLDAEEPAETTADQVQESTNRVDTSDLD